MPHCPHCQSELAGKLPRDTFNLKPYQDCPVCGGAFTVDAATRRRQVIAIFIALVALVLTLAMYLRGNSWLPSALLSYIALALWIYRGNKQVEFVVYEPPQNTDHNS